MAQMKDWQFLIKTYLVNTTRFWKFARMKYARNGNVNLKYH